LNAEQLRFLLRPRGRRLLEAVEQGLAEGRSALAVASAARGSAAASEVQAALDTALLRDRARAKFTAAHAMFFTRDALEQASAEVISGHRARRVAARRPAWIADLACGIGGDAVTLSAIAPVVGVDRDPVRLAMARENLRAYGRADRFLPLAADLEALDPISVDVFFFDPARRDASGKRHRRRYLPGLEVALRWLEHVGRGVVKLGPLQERESWIGELEVISVFGEVREAVAWCGDLAGDLPRRATLLPGGATFSAADEGLREIPCGRPAGFLYEPDRAVVRAGLVEALAEALDLSKIDPAIAYLTGDLRVETPFARRYAVEAVLPGPVKPLRALLRQRGIRTAILKKRGVKVDLDEVRRSLRLDPRPAPTDPVLFLTRAQGRATTVLARRDDAARETKDDEDPP
jgi:hypothetical protein